MDAIERRLIARFQERVRAMTYAPMSDADAAAAGKAYRAGEESNRLEGLESTLEDQAFAAMLIQERVPTPLWAGLAAAYARALIAVRAGGEPADG